MFRTTITITRELIRRGEIRCIEGMLHSDEMVNGCIFYIRRKKKKGVTGIYQLLVSRLYKTTPPVKVDGFPLYTTLDYQNREMIRWIGEHAPQLVRMSIR